MGGKRRGRGEGSIEKLPDGRWRAILSLGVDAGGKRIRKKLYGKTKQEAISKLRQAQQDHASGIDIGVGRTLTVGDWLMQWLELTKTKVEPQTLKFYEQRVRLHLIPGLGKHVLAKLKPFAIEKLLASLEESGVSRSEQCKAIVTLKAAINFAVRSQVLSHNPIQSVRKPKMSKEEFTAFTTEQVRIFLEAAKESEYYAYFVVAIDSGAGPGEMFGLKQSDFDPTNGTISISKSVENIGGVTRVKDTKNRKRRRTIQLSAFAALELKQYVEKLPPKQTVLFADSNGGHLDIANFTKTQFYRIMDKCPEIPRIRLYDLRHTCATLLLQAGVNVKVVSERLGHANANITLSTYAHFLPGMQAVAAGKMDEILRSVTNRSPEGKT